MINAAGIRRNLSFKGTEITFYKPSDMGRQIYRYNEGAGRVVKDDSLIQQRIENFLNVNPHLENIQTSGFTQEGDKILCKVKTDRNVPLSEKNLSKKTGAYVKIKYD